MESTLALKRLAALAHDGRLAAFRLLVRAGEEGMAAGELARALGVPANTLSSQVGQLAAAGLVASRREGRSILYAADYAAMGALLRYLMEDCCQGRPEVCLPALASAGAPPCQTETCGPAASGPGATGLRPLLPSDGAWLRFLAALAAAGLPRDDLSDPGQAFFSMDEEAAFGGLALAGPDILLRSLVVAEARRGQGLGTALVAALLDRARRDGARAAWLLTNGAADFFARQGFRPADRVALPPGLAAMRQVVSLCPAAAVVMWRPLA